jgi:hypothetical protein
LQRKIEQYLFLGGAVAQFDHEIFIFQGGRWIHERTYGKLSNTDGRPHAKVTPKSANKLSTQLKAPIPHLKARYLMFYLNH